MMEEKITHLCIGGPRDGEYVDCAQPEFIAHERLMTPVGGPGAISPTATAPNPTLYVREQFRAGDLIVSVFRPANQPIEETLKLMIGRYTKPQKCRLCNGVGHVEYSEMRGGRETWLTERCPDCRPTARGYQLKGVG